MSSRAHVVTQNSQLRSFRRHAILNATSHEESARRLANARGGKLVIGIAPLAIAVAVVTAVAAVAYSSIEVAAIVAVLVVFYAHREEVRERHLDASVKWRRLYESATELAESSSSSSLPPSFDEKLRELQAAKSELCASSISRVVEDVVTARVSFAAEFEERDSRSKAQ